MRSKRKPFLLVLLVFMCAVSGFAVEKGTLGLLFKADSMRNVGVSYELSGVTTLRVTFGFDTSDTDTEIHQQYLTHAEYDIDKFDISLGFLFSLMKKRDLSLYGGFEVGYAFEKHEGRTSPYITAGGVGNSYEIYVLTERTNFYSGNLMLGARHKIGKKVALFGEIGFGVSREKTKDRSRLEGLEYGKTETRWNLSRSGIGIVFYF